jgi:hypothetical protein
MTTLPFSMKIDIPIRDTARAARLGEQWLSSLSNRGLDEEDRRFFLSPRELEILEFVLDDVAKRAEGLVALLEAEAEEVVEGLNRTMQDGRQ